MAGRTLEIWGNRTGADTEHQHQAPAPPLPHLNSCSLAPCSLIQRNYKTYWGLWDHQGHRNRHVTRPPTDLPPRDLPH